MHPHLLCSCPRSPRRLGPACDSSRLLACWCPQRCLSPHATVSECRLLSIFTEVALTEALLYTLFIIVGPSTRLSSLCQTLQHDSFAALEEEDEARAADLGNARGSQCSAKWPSCGCITALTVSSKPSAWSIFRGNPSMRKRPFSLAHLLRCSSETSKAAPCVLMASLIAFCKRAIVTSCGTIFPSLMWSAMSCPYSEPSRCCSARSRSPAKEISLVWTSSPVPGFYSPLRWTKP